LSTEPTTQQQAPSAADQQPSSAPPVSGGATPEPVVASGIEKPEGLDDRFFDPKTGVKWADLTKEVGELSAFKAEAEAAKGAVPQSADEYKINFPDGYQLPEGFQIDEASPLWKQGREMAAKAGFTQEQFGHAAATMVDILAKQEAGAEAVFSDYAKSESAKLGANAAAVSDAVVQWVDKTFSPEAAKIIGASRLLVNAEVLKGFTEVMRAASSGGVSSLNGGARDGANGAVSEDDWNKMSFTQRMGATLRMPARN
jgi:hypothetical protein